MFMFMFILVIGFLLDILVYVWNVLAPVSLRTPLKQSTVYSDWLMVQLGEGKGSMAAQRVLFYSFRLLVTPDALQTSTL